MSAPSRLLGLLVLGLATFVVVCTADSARAGSVIRDGWRTVRVTASAPLPLEVEDPEEARRLAEEAAVTQARTDLLSHIMKKRTRSRKTLDEAAYPSLELQERIQALIAGTQIQWVRWRDGVCRVTIVLEKKPLRRMLRHH